MAQANRLAKWQVLEMVERFNPACLPSVDRFYEDFLDFIKWREMDFTNGAIAFCEWRGDAI